MLNLLKPKMMSQRNSGYERKDRDLYETPDWVTEALLPFIPHGASIWEPACASGKICKILKENKHKVYATDLVTNYGVTGVDFLGNDTMYLPPVDGIITNPPFNKAAEAFIRRSLKLMKPQLGYVAMLLPVDFDSGKTRRDMFEDCPAWATKLILTSRITWFDPPPGAKGKSPSQNHAWFIWDWARGTRCIKPATMEYHFRTT